MVKLSNALPQGARRKMASTSIRNLVSQVSTLLVTSFVEGDYEKPNNLPHGYSLARNIMKNIIGQ